MNPDLSRPALPDTFALRKGELIALQVHAAHAFGLADTRFHDTLPDGSAAPELVVIPAGAFEYGAAPRETAPAQDRPRRAALIERNFAIGVYPVTTVEFEAYARATGWRPRLELLWLSGRKPVINVRQSDARDYCDWLSRANRPALSPAHRTGMGIRLPRRRGKRLSAGRPHHRGRSALQRQPELRRRST
jgi:formylglycine-generating enzyme required for sulfatase activity